MKLQFIPKLSPAQIYEAQRDSHALWGEDYSLEERLAKLHIFLKEEKILSMCGIINEHGILLCSMKRYALTLILEKQKFPIVGIGALFTHEEHRKKGIAQELIEMVVNEAHQSGFKAALLFSDIAPAYYQKLGFVAVEPALNMTIDIHQIASSPLALSYRSARKEDIEQLLAYHRMIFPPHVARCERDVYTWNFFRERHGFVEDYLVSYAGEDVGYFSISTQKNKLVLNEFFVPKEWELSLLNLLKKFAEHMGVKQIEGWKIFQELAEVPKNFHKRDGALPMIRYFANQRFICHPRAGGDPGAAAAQSNSKNLLDSRLRGNDSREKLAWFDALDQF